MFRDISGTCLWEARKQETGNREKSFKIMKIKMFATLDNEKSDTENIRSLNLAAVTYTTVQVSKMLWKA
jgi:hypothetical protein